MGIKIDELTKICYESYIIDARVIAEDYTNFLTKKDDISYTLSQAPEYQLVLRDILDFPVEIIRNSQSEELVIQATIGSRHAEGQRKEFDRPYKSIVLLPVIGQIASLKTARNLSVLTDR